MTNFKDHEKFVAFLLLGAALMTLACMLYLKPLPATNNNAGVLQILNMIIGAFIGAFGASASKLFDAKVTVDNPPSDPVPTQPVDEPVAPEASKEELPSYAS